MSIKEKLSYFWNITLGVDEEETINLETSKDSKYKELRESLQRVSEMENKFGISSAEIASIDAKTVEESVKKVSGKRKSKNVVQKVEVDYKTIEEAAKRLNAKREATQKDTEGRER